MLWLGTFGGVVFGPRRVPDSVNMSADSYVGFSRKHFEPWFKKQRGITLKSSVILMEDNANTHSAKLTTGYLQQLDCSGPRKMN